VGTAHNEEELSQFMTMAERLKETLDNELRPKLFELPEKIAENRLEQVQMEMPTVVNLSHLREEKRVTKGFHDVYGKLFDQVGYDNILKSKKSSAEIFKDIVMARLAKPVSKRASCEMLAENFGIEHQLGQIYRMMDDIISAKKNSKKEIVRIDKIPQIQEVSMQYTKQLLHGKIMLFFYDCTTLYFESFTEDDLRKLGYSKDNKFNQGQVLLALMVTEGGLPVGYEVFAGNMYEGNTFSLAIDKLKTQYSINEAIIVADSGLLSDKNKEIVKTSGYQYILGARLKNLDKNWQKNILENREYDDVRTVYYKDNEASEDKNIIKIKDNEYSKDVRLIVSHSSARASKDKHDREKGIAKVYQKLTKSKKATDFISNYGYKKYLKIEGESTISINRAKVAQSEQWDGLHGVYTNIKKEAMDCYSVLNEYHGLWQVEDSFRIDKHDLRMRPVFHWNSNRIKAHIAICYVAFSLIRFLQHRIKQEVKEQFSAQRISIELNSVQESILHDLKDRKKKYVIPSKLSDNASKIYESMKIHRSAAPHRLRE
jgi:transposase